MKKNALVIISCIVLVLLLVGFYLLALPAINFKSPALYVFIFIILAFVSGTLLVLFRPKIILKLESKKDFFKKNIIVNNKVKVQYVSASEKFKVADLFAIGFTSVVVLMILFFIICGVSESKLFRAKAYYEQLTIEEGSNEEFNETFNIEANNVKLPMIDKDLAFKLAQSKLSSYGAQYSIDSERFTLISSNDELIRVTPLEYSGLFVSLSKMNEGSIGYIKVNVNTMESELVVVDGGIKYLPSAKFGRDLKRHVRLNYPTTLFSEFNFEIDDEGHPYWIAPTYNNEISLFGGGMSTGVIICDAVSGEVNKYKIGEEPKWVDRVVDEMLVDSQATNRLKYKNGFFNAVMGQKKEVFQLSDGYNYFIKDGHTYYVSCVTSPNENDQTSIGFVTIDLKTRVAKKYNIEGITEMRCRSIASLDESVKAQELDSTWPILVSLNNVATYFVVLKNEVQPQKVCLINVHDGSKVSIESNLNSCINKYQSLIAGSSSKEEYKEIESIVTSIRDLGSSIEFMIKDCSDKYFVVNVELSLQARFLEKGQKVNIKYNSYNSYNYVTEINVIND